MFDLAIRQNDVDSVKGFICTNNKLINTKSNISNTPLHTAAEVGSVEIVELLIEAGAKINARNDEDYTPQMVAKIHGHTEIEKILRIA